METVKKRNAKAIPNPDSLDNGQIRHLAAAVRELHDFLDLHHTLKGLNPRPTEGRLVSLRNEAWASSIRHIRASKILKNKRKPVSAEIAKLNKEKGSLLANTTKMKKKHGENSTEYKQAVQKFQNKIVELARAKASETKKVAGK